MNRIFIKILKFIVRRIASYHRFIDPVDLLAKLARFGQPSEVAVPTELLRAGARMHARGLLNSQAIQYNLDWVWPYWVDRQFDPADESFVPRAFSLTHINLTHRNWTCVGSPGEGERPIVDPRGLVTPLHDGWSLDFWLVSPEGTSILLSEAESVEQEYRTRGNPGVTTQRERSSSSLRSQTRVVSENRRTDCRVTLTGESNEPGWVVASLRPYNPEGISTIDQVQVQPDLTGWVVREDETTTEVSFDPPPDRHVFSNFDQGDVYHQFPDPDPAESVNCDLGMVSGAACWKISGGSERSVEVSIPLKQQSDRQTSTSLSQSWDDLSLDRCAFEVPDKRYEFLFRSSLKTLHLLSDRSVHPGPFTYRRFWYRDAAFMLHALLVTGYEGRVGTVLQHFPEEQTVNGYFCSQKGEWDSNGEALWILGRYCDLLDRDPAECWRDSIRPGADWITHKRTDSELDEPHAGLLPAGFSAEHFGPNDYYYWDDFWGVAGLESAADMLDRLGETRSASEYRREARDLLGTIERAMEPHLTKRSDSAMAASPYREVDAGAVGSLVAGYPLDLFPAGDNRLMDTADRLIDECFFENTFFQEMIHSGKNPYLSLHIAQVLMKGSDRRFHDIVDAVAEMASQTGKWPEAVHPATEGGCMGDGEHGWAAAEWILMMRNSFVLESEEGLVVGQGIPPEWLRGDDSLRFGPTATPYGSLEVKIDPADDEITVELTPDWHDDPPVVTVRLPQREPVRVADGRTTISVPEDEPT